MSFFKNMFGKKDPIDEMRQFQTQKDWAGLLSATKRVDRSDLDEESCLKSTHGKKKLAMLWQP